MDAVSQVKTDLLQAKIQGMPITLGLPKHPAAACAVLQAVQGVVPYVALDSEYQGEEIDLVEIRESVRDSLSSLV